MTVFLGLPWEIMPSGTPRPQRVNASFAPKVPEEEAPARIQSRREEVAPREYYVRRTGHRVICPGCEAAKGNAAAPGAPR